MRVFTNVTIIDLKPLCIIFVASLQELKCLQTAVSSEDGEVHSSIL